MGVSRTAPVPPSSALCQFPEGEGLDGGGLGHDLIQGFEPVGRLEGETFRRVDPTELIWFQWNGPRLTVVSSRCLCGGPSLAPRCVSRWRARSSDAGAAIAKTLVFLIEVCYICCVGLKDSRAPTLLTHKLLVLDASLSGPRAPRESM